MSTLLLLSYPPAPCKQKFKSIGQVALWHRYRFDEMCEFIDNREDVGEDNLIKLSSRADKENKHTLFAFIDAYLYESYVHLYWWEAREAHAHLAYESITRLKTLYATRLKMDNLPDAVKDLMQRYQMGATRKSQLLAIMKRFRRALSTHLQHSLPERHVSMCFFWSAQSFDIDSDHERERQVGEALRYIPHGPPFHQNQPATLQEYQAQWDEFVHEVSTGAIPPLPQGVHRDR